MNESVGVNKKFTFRIRSMIVVGNQFHCFYKHSVILVKVRCKIALQQLLVVSGHKLVSSPDPLRALRQKIRKREKEREEGLATFAQIPCAL